MANESITFSCPACGIKLTIPGTMAGVTGPCPSCRTQIQAPYPAPAPVQPVSPPPAAAPVYQAPAPEIGQPYGSPVQPTAYQPPVQPPVSHEPPLPVPAAAPAYQQPQAPQAYQPQAVPSPSTPPPGYYPPPQEVSYPAGYPPSPGYAPQGYQPTPVAPAYPAHPPQGAQAPAYSGYSQGEQPASPPVYPPSPPPLYPAQAEPPVLKLDTPVLDPAASHSPSSLRPEPRQLPTRSGTGEVVAKQMPDPDPSVSRSRSSGSGPRHSHRRSPVARFMKGALFLLAAALVVFGINKTVKNRPEEPAAKPGPPIGSSVFLPADASSHPEAPTATEQTPPSLPVQPAEQPSILQADPELPEGLEPMSPSSRATEVLIKFLGAKSLEERLPMIETKTPEAELATSCLASTLPTAPVPSIDAIENNAIEQTTDFYHRVMFDGPANQNQLYTVLVRIRGASPPKVVVDPFLDSYGGRLAAYAKTPSEKAGIFQVIVSALASCYDERVPNREKKLTLKLLPHDEAKEIVPAYFGRQSKIGLMLEDGTYSLSYGKAKACTVMLRWNTEDDPARPYLEALDLKTLDWNP